MNFDLKEMVNQVLREIGNKEMTSVVFLSTFGETEGVTAILSEHRKICIALAQAMAKNPEFSNMFETAWAAIAKEQAGLN